LAAVTPEGSRSLTHFAPESLVPIATAPPLSSVFVPKAWHVPVDGHVTASTPGKEVTSAHDGAVRRDMFTADGTLLADGRESCDRCQRQQGNLPPLSGFAAIGWKAGCLRLRLVANASR
jgi:hypothetical protein